MFLPGSSIIEDARRHSVNLIAWIVLDKPDLSSANNPQTRKFHFFFLVSDLLSISPSFFHSSRMPEAMAVIGIKFPFTYSSLRKSLQSFSLPLAVNVKRFKKRKTCMNTKVTIFHRCYVNLFHKYSYYIIELSYFSIYVEMQYMNIKDIFYISLRFFVASCFLLAYGNDLHFYISCQSYYFYFFISLKSIYNFNM